MYNACRADFREISSVFEKAQIIESERTKCLKSLKSEKVRYTVVSYCKLRSELFFEKFHLLSKRYRLLKTRAEQISQKSFYFEKIAKTRSGLTF